MNTSAGWAAIVLAGGAARRLGGVEKPLLTIEGTALLTRVLDAVPDARPRIVAGPPALRPAVPDDAVLVQEDPPGAGPVAAIRAAIGLVPPTVAVTAVLAGDLPFVTSSVLYRLRDALGENDVALLTDADGRRQNLLGVWRTERLRAALLQTASAAVRDLLDRLTVIAVPPGAGRPWLDCDTPEDLDLARRIAGQKPSDSSSAWTADR